MKQCAPFFSSVTKTKIACIIFAFVILPISYIRNTITWRQPLAYCACVCYTVKLSIILFFRLILDYQLSFQLKFLSLSACFCQWLWLFKTKFFGSPLFFFKYDISFFYADVDLCLRHNVFSSYYFIYHILLQLFFFNIKIIIYSEKCSPLVIKTFSASKGTKLLHLIKCWKQKYLLPCLCSPLQAKLNTNHPSSDRELI